MFMFFVFFLLALGPSCRKCMDAAKISTKKYGKFIWLKVHRSILITRALITRTQFKIVAIYNRLRSYLIESFILKLLYLFIDLHSYIYSF